MKLQFMYRTEQTLSPLQREPLKTFEGPVARQTMN